MSTVRVEIDPDVCIGIGQCEAIADHMFEFDPERGRSVVVAQPGDRDDAALARQAVEACPSGALRVAQD